ncbi:hypothetical protein [Streptomyces sp. NPDC059168]|uniref:hypothetical protein n=1 Tax=Streptomyces sp. NPDC059168 TaxID=3346753 RepID=UPI0036CA8471
MRKPIRGGIPTAACLISLAFPLLLAAPGAAAPLTTATVPSCLAMYQSWRYTEVANDCAGPESVRVVYQDGSASLCAVLAPLAVRTVGEGYLGLHGRADHLETCEASPQGPTGAVAAD